MNQAAGFHPDQFPNDPVKLREWLQIVAQKQEVYEVAQQRMKPLAPLEVIAILRSGLRKLNDLEKQRAKERNDYLLNRFGTVFRTLDTDQPAEGDLIIAELEGQRAQCVVKGGVAFHSINGQQGQKFCPVAKLSKWRPCELPEAPAVVESPGSGVREALERGRLVREGKLKEA